MRAKMMAMLVFAFFCAAQAGAGPPMVAFSTYPAGIRLVGAHDGVPDAEGAAVYVMRRSSVILPGVFVVIDFSECPDVRLADVSAPGTTIDCANRRVSAFTDQQGMVTFRIVGSRSASGSLPACAKVYADGLPFPSPLVSAFDLDGVNGVDGIDASILVGDLFSGGYHARSDYDFDGDVDGLDASLFVRVMHGGGSNTSGAPLCGP